MPDTEKTQGRTQALRRSFSGEKNRAGEKRSFQAFFIDETTSGFWRFYEEPEAPIVR
jgi:hypothetical protein